MKYEYIIPAIDRILLISWLIKDFGWMTTNIYLGWPFGTAAMFFHVINLIYDPRSNFKYYNLSFVMWVAGNWIWMTVEYTTAPVSSDIHWGPPVPASTMPPGIVQLMNSIKLALFIGSLVVQIVMVVRIYLTKTVAMPRNYDEDYSSVNDIAVLFGRRSHEIRPTSSSRYSSRDLDANSGLTIQQRSINLNGEITVAFVENSYMFFWIMKDLFWSIGTGDLKIHSKNVIIFCEAAAQIFGSIAIIINCFTIYIYRNDKISLFDAITTLLWIAANYVWMTGEFFLRYHHLDMDDYNSGNDRETRIFSAILFSSGLAIQVGLIVHLVRCRKQIQRTQIYPSDLSVSETPSLDFMGPHSLDANALDTSTSNRSINNSRGYGYGRAAGWDSRDRQDSAYPMLASYSPLNQEGTFDKRMKRDPDADLDTANGTLDAARSHISYQSSFRSVKGTILNGAAVAGDGQDGSLLGI